MANNYVLRRKQRVSGRLSRFFTKTFIDEKLYNWFGCILLGLIAVAIGYLMARQIVLGLTVIGVGLALCVVLPSLANGPLSLYFVLFYNYFIYMVPRLLDNTDLKVGIPEDGLIVCALLGFVMRREHLKGDVVQLFRTRVMGWALALYGLTALEFLNPLAHSFDGWQDAFRHATENFLLLVIAYFVFTTKARIDQYLLVLFWASLLVALYGCIQQWHGMFPFEMRIISRMKYGLGALYYAGQIRKWSTVSSATAFGMDMAAMAALYTILGLNEKRVRRKWLYLIGVIPMLLGMTYSGTRTSNVMFVAGLGLYTLLHMDEKRTRIFAVVTFLLLLAIIKLPFYGGPTVQRFRTSFEGKSDASYNVREVNRKRIQPYIYTHPIGGGLGTTNNQGNTYNPGHYLAGFQTDDGYLKTALEMGYIGLLLSVILNFNILSTGVRKYFRTQDEWEKTILAASMACIFTYVVGDLAQEGIGEISSVCFYFPVIAIILRIGNTRTVMAGRRS